MTVTEPQINEIAAPAGASPGVRNADAVVIAEIGADDLTHLDAFVNAHKAPLMRYLLHQTRDLHEAEDLTQEVFLRAIRSAKTGGFEGRSSVRTWLFQVARNCITDHARRRDLRRTRPLDGVSEQKSDALSPLALAINSEGERRVQAMLDQLPPAQAQVLSLKVLGGLTAPEVAAVTGEPLETIKSRLRYALQKVHEMLLAQGGRGHG